MNRIQVITKLFELGWLPGFNNLEDTIKFAQDVQIMAALVGYFNFHKINYRINDNGGATLDDLIKDFESSLELPRCSLPDVMPLVEQLQRWNPTISKNIKWSILTNLNPLTQDQFKEAITEALRRIAKVCNVTHTYTTDPNSANILVDVRMIDGSGRVLAESELPNEQTRSVHQWYDSGDRWILTLSGDPGNSIDIIRVACHELCHAHGVSHIAAGNLMAPIYSRSIWEPQAGDIAELQARYGQPSSVPPITPPVTPGGTGGTLSSAFFKLLFDWFVQNILPQLIKALTDWIKNNPTVLIDILSKLHSELEKANLQAQSQKIP